MKLSSLTTAMRFHAAFALGLAALVYHLAPCPALPVRENADPLLNPPATTGRTPIALLHMYDDVSFFRRLGALTGENKRRYAARHGYDMVESTPLRTTGILKMVPCKNGHTPDAAGKCWEEDKDFDIDHSRAPTFGKIKLALAACDGRDNGWLLWSDADAMVVNQTVPLETLIDDGYDLMLAYDWLVRYCRALRRRSGCALTILALIGSDFMLTSFSLSFNQMLNAGMLLMKCSAWMKAFLHNVYDARKFDKARALDQSSFQEHLDNLTRVEHDLHVKVVPKYAMNVYTEEYRPGDFLLHMAGKLYEATEPGLFAIATQFDILSMVEDREDIEAFFRSTRLLNYYSGVCKVVAGQRQSSCKPIDSRRVLLNESLGSMSTPNRYRHVGLRYYWLGDWKDKYDVPGWDIKRKALPIPEKAPSGKEMPGLPLSVIHHDLPNNGAPSSVDTGQGGGTNKDAQQDKDSDAGGSAKITQHDDNKAKHDAPEVDHDIEVRPVDGKNDAAGDVGTEGGDSDADDSWPLWIRALLFGLGAAAVGVFAILCKKRTQKVSKMH